MSDDEINPARMALVDFELHRNKSGDDNRLTTPDLEPQHEMILDLLSFDRWKNRRMLLKKTGFRKKKLKKHIEHLKDHDYIQERSHPNEGRAKQYKRIDT